MHSERADRIRTVHQILKEQVDCVEDEQSFHLFNSVSRCPKLCTQGTGQARKAK